MEKQKTTQKKGEKKKNRKKKKSYFRQKYLKFSPRVEFKDAVMTLAYIFAPKYEKYWFWSGFCRQFFFLA